MIRLTSRGIGLTSAGLTLVFFASAMASAELAVLAAVALVPPVLSLLWLAVSALGGSGTSLIRRITPPRPKAGSPARVWLELIGGAHPRISVRERVPAALHRTHTDSAGYTVTPTMRGLYTLGPARIVRTDPLHLSRSRTNAQTTTQVLVWPAIDDLSMIVRLWADRQTEHAMTGRPERSPDDLTLREYQPGDDLHRVHWRASARHGELLTRQDEPAQERTGWVLLDLGPAEEAHPDSASEWLLRATASFTVALLAEGFRLQCSTVWIDPVDDATRPTGPMHLLEQADALDVFARTQHGTPELDIPDGPLTIACLRAPAAQTVSVLAKRPGRCLAILVDADPDAVGQLTESGWLVAEETPGADLTQAWANLVGGW